MMFVLFTRVPVVKMDRINIKGVIIGANSSAIKKVCSHTGQLFVLQHYCNRTYS